MILKRAWFISFNSVHFRQLLKLNLTYLLVRYLDRGQDWAVASLDIGVASQPHFARGRH